MKKSLKISLALAVCLVLVFAAFAAYKVYRHFEWNNFLINEKLDNISGTFDGLLLESGVTGLYTDFLTPADFAQG